MKRRKKNQKGFTLIELLAVIVILAILMTLAVVSMQRYITKAKRDTYATTALQFLNNIRFGVVNGEYTTPSYSATATKNCTAIKTDLVELDSGEKKSPFDKNFNSDQSFVVVVNSSSDETKDQLAYYITMNDANKNGFGVTEENALNGNKVQVKAWDGLDFPAVGDSITLPGGSTCTVEWVY